MRRAFLHVKSIVNNRCQVRIPKAVRKHLDIQAGDEIIFIKFEDSTLFLEIHRADDVLYHAEARIRPIHTVDSPFIDGLGRG